MTSGNSGHGEAGKKATINSGAMTKSSQKALGRIEKRSKATACHAGCQCPKTAEVKQSEFALHRPELDTAHGVFTFDQAQSVVRHLLAAESLKFRHNYIVAVDALTAPVLNIMDRGMMNTKIALPRSGELVEAPSRSSFVVADIAVISCYGIDQNGIRVHSENYRTLLEALRKAGHIGTETIVVAISTGAKVPASKMSYAYPFSAYSLTPGAGMIWRGRTIGTEDDSL